MDPNPLDERILDGNQTGRDVAPELEDAHLREEAANIGDLTDRNPSNLGDQVRDASDRVLPDEQPPDGQM